MHRLSVLCSLTFAVFALTALALAQSPLSTSPNQGQVSEVQPVPRAQLSLETATPHELEKRGDEFREEKDYLQALDYYNAAQKKQPTPIVQNKIGMTYIALQRYDKAENALKRALKMNKKYPEAYNNLGVVYHLRKKYGPAIKNYRKALELQETNASFHSNLATTYVQRKEFENAMAEYQRAFELDPNVFERSSRTGVAARMSSPEDRARFNYMVAKLYAKSGDIDQALQYLKHALEEGFAEINSVYKDREFAALRSDQRFAELMAARPTPIPQ